MLLGREGVPNHRNKQVRPCFHLDSVERGAAGHANRSINDEKKNHARGNVEILVTSHGLVEARDRSHPNFFGIHIKNEHESHVKFKAQLLALGFFKSEFDPLKEFRFS